MEISLRQSPLTPRFLRVVAAEAIIFTLVVSEVSYPTTEASEGEFEKSRTVFVTRFTFETNYYGLWVQ